MYKVSLKAGNATFVAEGATVKEVWEQMAALHEVFGEEKCGMCESEDIRPAVRTAGKKSEFEYCEWRCNNCNARLAVGQSKQNKGMLFPSRMIDKGDKKVFDKEHRGWSKYVAAPKEE